jgi:hypothetical protein
MVFQEAVQLREVARLGAVGGDVFFEEVYAAAISPSGVVAVLDRDAKRVALMDVEGDGVRWIGRAGQGPGEFDLPLDVFFREDTVFVGEARGRLTAFRKSGTLLGTLPKPPSLSSAINWWRPLRHEVIVGYEGAVVSPAKWPPDMPQYTVVLDDVAGLREVASGETGHVMVRVGGDVPHPVPGGLPAQLAVTVLGDSAVVVVDGFEGRVSIFTVDESGAMDLAQEVALPVQGGVYGGEDVDRWRRAALDFRGEVRPLSDVEVALPQMSSPYRSAIADDTGTVWLHQAPPGTEAGGGALIPVRSTGVGTNVDLPTGFVPLAVGGGRVVGYVTDHYDAQVVVVLTGLPTQG